MQKYIIKRFLYMILLLITASFMSFIIIQLPPGDFVDDYVAELSATGRDLSPEEILSLKHDYGLDLPILLQYTKWIYNMFQGNFGISFSWSVPVRDLIVETMPLTVLISVLTLIFTYVMAIPIGIYSARHQYSFFDYVFTIIGFLGLAIPNFLLALILMLTFYGLFDISIGGLYSPEFDSLPMSFNKFIDLLKHLPTPIIVVGTSGTAGLIRMMRGNLLDELKQQYVTVARAKGMEEDKLTYKYPVRIALNPIISQIANTLPGIISGATIVSLVLSLPTAGPLLLKSLLTQDMYLAGAIVMMMIFMSVIGSFVADILLVIVDPRIKMDKTNN